jgi:hypothetical protein
MMGRGEHLANLSSFQIHKLEKSLSLPSRVDRVVVMWMEERR